MVTKTMKSVYLGTTVLLVLLAGIGICVFLKMRPHTTACDDLDPTCDGINDPPENFPTVLIYSSEKAIEIFNPSTNTSAPLITTDSTAHAVSVDAKYVYWSNYGIGNNGIYRAFRNGTETEVIAFRGIGDVQEIAVDWITGNIYFIDKDQPGIGVCTSSGSHCTSITTGAVTPQKLALHPKTGMMYWSASGSHIFRSEMDGKSQVPMVSDPLGRPTVLTIDYSASRLYWVDAGTGTIESMYLNGTQRKTVLPFNGTASSMSVSGSELFWNDMMTNSIYSCNKSTGQGTQTLVQHGVIDGFHIPHPSLNSDLRPGLNPCINNPCEGICMLAADRTYTCACNSGKKLKTDGKTCERIKDRNHQHLIVAAGGVLYDYNHGTLGQPYLDRINDFHHFAEVYNLTDMKLSSNHSRMIFDEFSRFFGVNGTLGEIAFDHVGLNLYSTNPQHKRIEITSLSTAQTVFIQFDEEPRAILLLPESSIMIVTLCRNSFCTATKMSMTGKGAQTLRHVGSKRVPLAFNYAKKRLLLTGGEIIESISLHPGIDSKNEVYTPKNAVSLAILGDRIFWTEKNTKKIFWDEKDSKKQLFRNKIGMAGFNVKIPADVDVMHLIQPSSNHKSERLSSGEPHECQVNNGECSHVCLVESEDSRVCRCPPDIDLDTDERTCETTDSGVPKFINAINGLVNYGGYFDNS